MIGRPEGEVHPFRLTLVSNRVACTKHDPEVFFPDPSDHAGAEYAKGICKEYCRFQAECLLYALDTDDQWAVLGGTTPDERRRMKRQNRKAIAA